MPLSAPEEDTAFDESLEAARKLRQDLDILRVQTALLRMDAEDRLHETRTDLETRLAGRRADLEARLEELRSGPETGWKGSGENRISFWSFKGKGLPAAIRNTGEIYPRPPPNPTASSRRYKDEFQDMIHYLEDSGKGQSPF